MLVNRDTKYKLANLNESDRQYLESLKDEYLVEQHTFTEEDYANLYRNLLLFKEGDREATQYIISAFHRVLNAYACFIVLHKIPYTTIKDKNGRIYTNRMNKSIYSFICLFVNKRILAQDPQKTNNRGYSMSKQRIMTTCDYIYSLFNKYEYGDIYNELVLALLNMANKYKIITDPNDPKYKPNGTFHVYVEKCFHYEAFAFLTKLIKDPITNVNFTELTSYDEEEFTPVIQKSNMLIDQKQISDYNLMIDYIDRKIALEKCNGIALKEDDVDIYDTDSLNFNWISGTVCNDAFKVLTTYERELIILAFIKNQTEEDIASIFHCSRAAIGVQKRKAIKKIEDYLKQKGGLVS